MAHWISFKFRKIFHGSCIESPKESHCPKIHLENFCVSLKTHKNWETFLPFNFCHLSYNTVVLYSRDRYEIIGLLKISHSIKQPCNSVCLKKAPEMHQKC